MNKLVCPICGNKEHDNNQCNICDWEFSYFTENPSEKNKKISNEKITTYKVKYLNKLLNLENHYDMLSENLLQKNTFTKTDEHRKYIKSLGYLKIGTVKFIDYNSDKEELNISLKYDDSVEELNYDINISNIEIVIKMDRDNAKIIFNHSEVYDLLAIIDYDNNKIVYEDVKFLNYSLYDKIKQFKYIETVKKVGEVSVEIAIGIGSAIVIASNSAYRFFNSKGNIR